MITHYSIVTSVTLDETDGVDMTTWLLTREFNSPYPTAYPFQTRDGAEWLVDYPERIKFMGENTCGFLELFDPDREVVWDRENVAREDGAITGIEWEVWPDGKLTELEARRFGRYVYRTMDAQEWSSDTLQEIGDYASFVLKKPFLGPDEEEG